MKMLSVTMDDGSKWGVPVDMIARNRATHYAHEFDGDIERSLAEDTLPLFESDNYEIEDWASNNMDWHDFKGREIKLEEAQKPDFQNAWVNGKKEVVEICGKINDYMNCTMPKGSECPDCCGIRGETIGLGD